MTLGSWVSSIPVTDFGREQPPSERFAGRINRESGKRSRVVVKEGQRSRANSWRASQEAGERHLPSQHPGPVLAARPGWRTLVRNSGNPGCRIPQSGRWWPTGSSDVSPSPSSLSLRIQKNAPGALSGTLREPRHQKSRADIAVPHRSEPSHPPLRTAAQPLPR